MSDQLIDTDWATDYLGDITAATDLRDELVTTGIAISDITYIEIFGGIAGGRDPENQERAFNAFLYGVEILGVDVSIARRTGATRANLRRQGHSIIHRAMDLIIAATAIERDLILVTRNTRDYEDVRGLRLYLEARRRTPALGRPDHLCCGRCVTPGD